jgi:hypothetical protein
MYTFPTRSGILESSPELTNAQGDATAATALGDPISPASLLERFFTDGLMGQRQASPHTISSPIATRSISSSSLPSAIT